MCTFLACSGSDNAAGISDASTNSETVSEAGKNDSSASSGDAGDGLPPNTTLDPSVDTGKPGCTAKKIGPLSGKTARSVPRRDGQDGAPWLDPLNALAKDSSFARSELGGKSNTQELQITNFGFALPPDAFFLGVEVELSRQAPDKGLVDDEVALIVPNKTGRFKFIATAWPSSIVGEHHYGQALDTWGMDMYPADVEPTDFGVRIMAKRDADAGVDAPVALVDGVRISVWYCN
ncbi:hypothetical protein AKJ09_05595 [Labilithrix luteola]|uniref:Uncharacterized protein n=2 Tax=Labilithrix luteola TaxID=1391654 RepID=A0A0K1PZX2_9BACT|nr:hypothetical protein AKJ09_05595 [Labilithrix luteola]